ncbi:MAG: UDP-N-acetylmuramoyl-L-alanyl-D-glutamate--2,6-diaminopimelate ligase [Anaerotardibacter sp.]
MKKTCKDLFSNFKSEILGDENQIITGISYRSDAVESGNAFCCIVGLKSDGHSYAQDAVDRGARTLIVQHPVEVSCDEEVTQVVVDDSREAMAYAAAQFYGNASANFNLVGVTGTNGKTTTTYLVNHIAQSQGKKVGLIGTVEISIDGQVQKASHTTPESGDLQQLFAEMNDAGCEVVSMEVSSHALDLKRVWASQFSVTAFTNLTQDHLDYHKTFEAYYQAKALLFGEDYPAARVINIDDQWGARLAKECFDKEGTLITTGFNKEALIHPVSVDYKPDCTTVVLSVRGEECQFTYPLVGKFNVENVMTAFGVGLQLGYSKEAIIEALETASTVPGRIERIKTEHDGGVSVYVDYAHTPDAIIKAVGSVKEITTGKTIVVFGCGGNRDRTKRPLMGQAALQGDFAVVTSDNPRYENPLEIIDDILEGIKGNEDRYVVEPDRRSAIAKAISFANAGDAILICGKGHEDYQLVGDQVLSFDDRLVACEELEKAFK